MKVTVTGATGLIGSRLVGRLLERGDEVTVLSREPEEARSALGDVDAVAWEPTGGPADVIDGMDLFIGVSGAKVMPAHALSRMNADAMVFAMANPNPEVAPEEAAPYVRIMATGRSDYPNQINNVLAFPGIFRGALDVRAPQITEPMKMAAGKAIADIITAPELREDYIIPSVFNRDVADAVAEAVAAEAKATGEATAGDEIGFADTDTHRVRAVT